MYMDGYGCIHVHIYTCSKYVREKRKEKKNYSSTKQLTTSLIQPITDNNDVSLNQAMSLLVEHNDDVQEAASVFLNRAEASARTAAMSTSSRNSVQRRMSRAASATSHADTSPTVTESGRGVISTRLSVRGNIVPDITDGSIRDDDNDDDGVCRGRVYVRALPVDLVTGNVNVVMILDRNSRPVEGGLQCPIHRQGPGAYTHPGYQQLQTIDDVAGGTYT